MFLNTTRKLSNSSYNALGEGKIARVVVETVLGGDPEETEPVMLKN